MNHEQLAFFNQQLAGMLKAGLPLEGSLREIASSMRRGELREEIETLERDLAQGIPLEQAIDARRLPDVYKAMVRAGAHSEDLPGVLTMAADHYTQTHANWTRLKGLMVYPGLVLATALGVAVLLGVIYTHMLRESAAAFGLFGVAPKIPLLMAGIWLPVVFIAMAFVLFLAVVFIRPLRQAARWRLPGFRESSLAQLASTMAVMLENGADLGTAIDVAQRNEGNNRVRRELAGWKQRLASGARQFQQIVKPGEVVPPLFVWVVAGAGENWARGFRRAAQTYENRAKYKTELVLYVALPVAILLLGAFITTETMPLLQGFARMMNDLGGDGGGL
jgi:type II secretory pathway component PulF